jgi:hypothetical protein
LTCPAPLPGNSPARVAVRSDAVDQFILVIHLLVETDGRIGKVPYGAFCRVLRHTVCCGINILISRPGWQKSGNFGQGFRNFRLFPEAVILAESASPAAHFWAKSTKSCSREESQSPLFAMFSNGIYAA